MEYLLDYDIVGEVLIPLENNLEHSYEKSNISLESILNKNFKDFRSILFQGELLRFFVVLKIKAANDEQLPNPSDFLNDLFIKFDFDPSCDNIEAEFKVTDDMFYKPEENDTSLLLSEIDKLNSELFSLHRNTVFSQLSNDVRNIYNYKNLNYDFISRRTYLEQSGIFILEVIRHISKYICELTTSCPE
jgi:hypothetical protein